MKQRALTKILLLFSCMLPCIASALVRPYHSAGSSLEIDSIQTLEIRSQPEVSIVGVISVYDRSDDVEIGRLVVYEIAGEWQEAYKGVFYIPLFQGREWDANAGQYYFRYRIEIPEWGTFTGQDMNLAAGIFDEAMGIGSYAALANDPVNNKDPLGLVNVVVSGTDGTRLLSKGVSDPDEVTKYLDYAGRYYFGSGKFESVGSFMTPLAFGRKAITMPIGLATDTARLRTDVLKNLTTPNFFTEDVKVNGGRVADLIAASKDQKDVLMGHSQGVTLIAAGLAQASRSASVDKHKNIKLILMAPKYDFNALEKYIAEAKKNQPGWKIEALVIGNRYDTSIPCGTENGYIAAGDSETETVRVQGGPALFTYRQQKRPGVHYGRGFQLGRQSAHWTTYEFQEPKDPHSSFLHTGLVSDPAAGVSELADTQSQAVRNRIQTFISK